MSQDQMKPPPADKSWIVMDAARSRRPRKRKLRRVVDALRYAVAAVVAALALYGWWVAGVEIVRGH